MIFQDRGLITDHYVGKIGQREIIELRYIIGLSTNLKL
jgi:hypothetical protein